MIVDANTVSAFNEHSRTWKDETLIESSTTAIALHPSYQRIIGLGPAVLPLIFQDLLDDDAHWFEL